MKRCLTAAAAMLVLAAVLLSALSLRLDGTATPLPYTVALARGDIAAAEGLRFRTAIKYGSQLRWDTVYNVHDNTWDTTHRLVNNQGRGALVSTTGSGSGRNSTTASTPTGGISP